MTQWAKIADRNARIVKLFASGETRREIADRFAIPYSTLLSVLRREGIIKANPREPKNVERDAKLAQLHEEGMAMREIARRTGIPYSTVYGVIKKAKR